MSLTTVPVDHLLGGVSQQPADRREPGQLEELENGLPSIAHGLRKRPPTSTVGTISNSQTGYNSAWVHAVNRTSSERYAVVIVGGDLKVFDTVTGTEETVYFPDGKAYLTGATKGFRAFTVGDHTFIANKDKVVKRGTKRSTARPYEALLYVRQADYGTEYRVMLDGIAVQYVTTAEASPDSRALISSYRVAEQLYLVLTTDTQLAATFDFEQMGSTIHVKRKDGSDFQAKVSDGLADKGLRLIKGSVQSKEDLPSRARDGMLVEIVGDPGKPEDNAWVVFETGTDNDGVWRETTGPDVILDLDRSTMPHELVRQGLLTKSTVSVDLPKKPLSANINNGIWYRGWEYDSADVALAWPNVYNGETTITSNTNVRSGNLPGTHATLTRKITVAFSLDTTTLFPDNTVGVVFSLNTGAGWVQVDYREYATGGTYSNQTFSTSTLINATTRVQLALVVPTYATDGSATRKARLICHGTGANRAGFPGITVSAGGSTGVYTGTQNMVWPMGTKVDMTFNGFAFSTTLAADKTTAQLNTDLAALVDAHASLKGTYVAKSATATPQLDWFEVQNNANEPVTVNALAFSFDDTKRCWNPLLTMTPGEYAGLTLKNLSDGSTGTIVTNSTTAFEVGALTGGTNNKFKNGDICLVENSGAAYFVFQQAPWTERTVGTDVLAPMPSFVDRSINEVFFHAGRLGFTSEDYVILSAVDNPYRFFRQTVTQVLDSDPIDVQSAHKDVALLDSALQWDGQLLLCSSSGHQFVLTGEPTLTPATVQLEHLASFPVTDKVRPLAVGASVVFPRYAAGYTQVRQMYRTRDRGLESTLLTEHVPRYLQGDIVDLCGDPDLGFFAVLTNAGSQNTVYVYNWGTINDREQQMAWHKWTFGGRVVAIDFVDGHLYLVVYRGSDVKLEKINVANPSGASADHRDAGSVAYTFRAKLSRPYIRDRFTGKTITTGRTQLRTLQVNHHDNGYFRVEVTPDNRSTKTYVVQTEEGNKRVPILAENKAVTIEIKNDQQQGCAFSGLVYEATFSGRSQRL